VLAAVIALLAEFAEPAAVLDPVVTVVMRLLAPPAMTDDRIPQTEGTPAKDLFRTSHRPVEARLAMVRRKWDKGNRTALEGSLAGRNLVRICASKKSLPPSRLISANRRINPPPLATEDWPVNRWSLSATGSVTGCRSPAGSQTPSFLQSSIAVFGSQCSASVRGVVA